MVIKRINPMSAAKVGGLLGLVVGLLIGACLSLMAMAFGGAAAAMNDEPGGGALGAFVGVGSIIVFPIVYAIFGFIGGLLQAFIYNLAAKYVGGLEIETA